MRSPVRTLAKPLAEGRVNGREAAVLEFAEQCQTCLYDFSVDGGAISTISFGVSLPANAVVVAVFSDEQTAVAGATDVTLKAGSTALTGSIDFTGDSGIQSRALAGSAAGIKLSSSSELNIAIGTAAATAGKIRFAVKYYISK